MDQHEYEVMQEQWWEELDKDTQYQLEQENKLQQELDKLSEPKPKQEEISCVSVK